MGRVLYVYAMTHDSGFAPCIRDNLLSLACCKGGKKGGMRKSAANAFISGDEVWVLGLCGKGMACGNSQRIYNPVYLAKVSDVVEMTDYFMSDNVFSKRNDHKAYKTVNGKLESQPENPHTHKDDQEKDINGKYVLLSDRFIYWGEKCGESGTELRQNYPIIFEGDENKAGIEKHCRNYIVYRNFNSDIETDLGKYDWFPSQEECKILTLKSICGEYIYIEDEEDSSVRLSCGGKK